ncbi:MAG: hypothetical protein R3C10_02120 [Pirellulales bacterium]|nr:hypothetical protein [Planctomycetales bacterium]
MKRRVFVGIGLALVALAATNASLRRRAGTAAPPWGRPSATAQMIRRLDVAVMYDDQQRRQLAPLPPETYAGRMTGGADGSRALIVRREQTSRSSHGTHESRPTLR